MVGRDDCSQRFSVGCIFDQSLQDASDIVCLLGLLSGDFENEKSDEILIIEIVRDLFEFFPLVLWEELGCQFLGELFVDVGQRFVDCQIIGILIVDYAEHQPTDQDVLEEDVETHGGLDEEGDPEFLQARQNAVVLDELNQQILIIFEILINLGRLLGQRNQNFIQVPQQTLLDVGLADYIAEQFVQMRVISFVFICLVVLPCAFGDQRAVGCAQT